MLNNMIKNLMTEYVDNGETKDVFKSEADHFVMLKQKMSLRVKKKIVLQVNQKMFLKGGEPKNVLKSAAEMILRVKQKLSI